jgi:hypothetical protein
MFAAIPTRDHIVVVQVTAADFRGNYKVIAYRRNQVGSIVKRAPNKVYRLLQDFDRDRRNLQMELEQWFSSDL